MAPFQESIFGILIGFFSGSLGTYLFVKLFLSRHYIEQGKKLEHSENSEARHADILEGIITHKNTEEFKSLLEVQFMKGVEEGEKRAMRKFVLSYDPFVEIRDTFLKKTADAGYLLQMYYNGLPFGDPMKRITTHEEKYKEENLKHLIDTVSGTLNNIILMADPLGLPVSINPKPKIQKKKK